MGVFIQHRLKPARMSIFQNALPVRFAGKLRPDGFDDFRMIEKREKGSPGARRDIAQRQAGRGSLCGSHAHRRASQPWPEQRRPRGPERSQDRPAGCPDALYRCGWNRASSSRARHGWTSLHLPRPFLLPAHVCARSARSHHSCAASGNSAKSSSIGASQYQRSSVLVVVS